MKEAQNVSIVYNCPIGGYPSSVDLNNLDFYDNQISLKLKFKCHVCNQEHILDTNLQI